jgi:hypothetical protein
MSTHWIGDRMGPRANLNMLEKRKISCFCWYSNPRQTSLITIPAMLPFLWIFNSSLWLQYILQQLLALCTGNQQISKDHVFNDKLNPLCATLNWCATGCYHWIRSNTHTSVRVTLPSPVCSPRNVKSKKPLKTITMSLQQLFLQNTWQLACLRSMLCFWFDRAN